jgi:AraC-like DNA-binding protein
MLGAESRLGSAMQLYRSADGPAARRAAYWNDVYNDRCAHVTFRPAREDFDAELRMSTLGPLGFADIRTSSTDIERTPSDVTATKSHLFSFLLLVQGAAMFSHYGREERLLPGDFTLCDNAAPHRMHLADTSRIILVRTSPAMLRHHLPCPEQLCGARLPGDKGLAPTVAAMAQSLWREIERGLDPSCHERVAGHLLDLAAAAYAMGLGHRMTNSTVVGSRKAQARQYIESRLQDPDLSPASVARGLRISPRYLRMLFADDDESVTTYISRRRLEECAKQIASPGWRNLTITEIAFHWGFNSSSHFARAFRRRFGMTATDLRRREAEVD